MMNIPAENKKRYIITTDFNEKPNFIIGSIGINSYVSNIILKATPGDEIINLQIGNFCSISNDIFVNINRNHDYKSVSQHFYSSGDSELDIFNFKEKKIVQKGQILIGNDVCIGQGVTLMSGIKIGNGALIGAGAVVACDIPPYAIAVGNPIKVIKYRFNSKQISKLLKIKWWNWSVDKIKGNIEWFKKDIDEYIDKFFCEPEEPKDVSMQKNSKSILFIPDFDMSYAVWDKVITEFTNKYSDKDDISLLLRIQQDNNFEKNISKVSELLSNKTNIPHILVVNDTVEDERSLFKNIDYFITTRSLDTIKYAEYADEFNVKILSGVDIPVFNI